MDRYRTSARVYVSLSLSFPHTISRHDRWLRAGLRRGRWQNRWRLLRAGNTHTRGIEEDFLVIDEDDDDGDGDDRAEYHTARRAAAR